MIRSHSDTQGTLEPHNVPMHTRRRFLQWAGAGAAASLAANQGFTQSQTSADAEPPHAAAIPLELGVASYTFMKFPLDRALAMTARVGLKHICLKSFHLPLDAKPERIAQVAAQVKAAGIDLYGGGVIYMKKPADVEHAFDYAKAAGMRVIIGSPSPDLLPLVNEKAQKYDIRVAIHNHGPADKVYPTPGAAYEKIKDLDRRVGLCMDVGHTVRAGADPSKAAEKCADRLLDIHMKDVTAATAKGSGIVAGRGVINIPQFLRTLEKIRYAGIVSFEYDEKNLNDPLPDLAESVGYVRGALAVIASEKV
jgi:inosose dehydratase